MRKLLLIACSLLLLTGCFGAITVHPKPPVHERVFSYTFENIQRSGIGEPMVYRVDGWASEGFIAIVPYQPEPEERGELRFARIETGSEWAVIGRTVQGDLVCRNERYPRPVIGEEMVPWNFCLMVTELGEPYGYSPCSDSVAYIATWQKKPYNFLKRTDKVFGRGSLRQEFVYTGKLKDRIMLTYREYEDNLMQPSFTQNLVYDLSRSPMIGLRGMHMEVLEANPAYIRFIVKTPFN